MSASEIFFFFLGGGAGAGRAAGGGGVARVREFYDKGSKSNNV